MANTDDWRARLREVLAGSAVFCGLDATALGALCERLEPLVVAAGEQVFAEHAPADRMYVVVSGRLRVWRAGGQGRIQLYNELGPGELTGETAMVLQQVRSANVTALRDSTLAVLTREAFEALLSQYPLPFNRAFSQSIFNYLRHAAQSVFLRRRESFAVVPLHADARSGHVAEMLAHALKVWGPAEHLHWQGGAGRALHGANLSEAIAQLDALESRYEFLVYEAEHELTEWTRSTVRRADQVIFVASSEAPSALREIERALVAEPGFLMKRSHLVLLHAAPALRPAAPAPWLASREVERVVPLREDHAGDFARLARVLTGHAVGLVLGGGGARGFAHIGVLRSLADAGIEVDLIGGNSMGALIGAQFAAGASLDEIAANTRAFVGGGEWPTVPLVSLLSGRRMERDLKRLFGAAQVDGLWRPFFAAACNLSRASTTVLESGELWRAVLASNSPAGLLPPVVHEGDLLVDGAILDNVPVAAMRSRLSTQAERRRGNGTVIAVDVDVKDEMCVAAEVSRLSALRHVAARVRGRVLPGIGDILYRASHIGGLTQRARTIEMADFYLQPPVGRFPIMGYARAREIIEVGYEYARAEVARWNLKSIAHR